jgi:hypothetical protein
MFDHVLRSLLSRELPFAEIAGKSSLFVYDPLVWGL